MQNIELTNEQIGLAAEAAFNVTNKGLSFMGHERPWRDVVRAAAPYLQAPIAGPTEEEIQRFGDVATAQIRRGHGYDFSDGLRDFISNRNAALTAKPDPRREAIISAIQNHRVIGDTQELRYANLADAILAGLDKVEAQCR